MLRAHGHERASLLDGGIQAWREAGLPLTRDEPRIEPVPPPPLRLDGSRLVERAEIERLVSERRGPVLLDARAPPRYRGETEPDRDGGRNQHRQPAPGRIHQRNDDKWSALYVEGFVLTYTRPQTAPGPKVRPPSAGVAAGSSAHRHRTFPSISSSQLRPR